MDIQRRPQSDYFIVPPPPCTTILLTEDFLTTFIIPPPPGHYSPNNYNKKFSSSSRYSENDADSDYHSVENSPVTPDLYRRKMVGEMRFSPLGASPPSSKDDSYITTTFPSDEITVHQGNGTSYHSNVRYHPVSQANPVQQHSDSDLLDNGPTLASDLRTNKMYSSLQRPSTAAAAHRKFRNRHGSHGELLNIPRQDYNRPQSPRDDQSILGNFGFENESNGDLRFRQAVLPDVHGAIDGFIRSEKRYLSDINSLLKVHVEPLVYQGCLNIDVVNSLKSSLLRLLHFHQRTCGDLELFFSRIMSKASDDNPPDYFAMVNYMCDTLMEYRGGFKTYINFCCTRAQLRRNIGQMDHDEEARWEKYLEQCNPGGEPSHSLEAGLEMPVQRITDYATMLSEVQHRGAIRTGILAEKLGRACTMLDGVSKAVDDRLKMQQEFSCMYTYNRKLEVLIGPIEELLHYGGVVEVRSRDIESFIPEVDTGLYLLIYKKGVALVQRIKIKKKHSFNKLISGGPPAPKSEYSLKKFYPVSCLQVRDLPHNHVFEITDTVNQTRVILGSRLIENKTELIKTIADIILDYDKFLSSSLQMKDAG